jgi:hypothetical protein
MDEGLGLRDLGLEFRVSVLGFEVQGLGCRFFCISGVGVVYSGFRI